MAKQKKKLKKGASSANRSKTRAVKGKPQQALKAPRGPVIDEKQLETLVRKGEERGFVTTSEILYSFPRIERDIEGFERVYDNFRERGIEIKEMQEF